MRPAATTFGAMVESIGNNHGDALSGTIHGSGNVGVIHPATAGVPDPNRTRLGISYYRFLGDRLGIPDVNALPTLPSLIRLAKA